MIPSLHWFVAQLLVYRYVALGALVYACAIGVPFLPVNAILLALGAFTGHGYFNFWAVFLFVFVVNTLGDLTGYVVARIWGGAIVDFFRIRRARFFVNLEQELRGDAVVTIFLTRFAGTISSITNLLAGVAGVPLKTFLWCDLTANLIEPFAWLGVGYLVGDYWSNISGIADIVAGGIGIAILVFILFRIQYRINKRFEKGGQRVALRREEKSVEAVSGR